MKHHNPAWFVCLAIALTSFAVPGTARAQEQPSPLSLARAVRLSFVQGTVTLERPGASTWTEATVNTPIQQGFSIATAKDAFAEIQFENGSTVRLGQLSRVDFSKLALAPDGHKVNHVTFDEGYATFHFIPERGDEYLVLTSGITLTPHGKAEFRTDIHEREMRVEVFEGDVAVANSHRSENLDKDKVLTCDLASAGHFEVTSGIAKDDWDNWVAARDEQSTLAYHASAISINAPTYGWDDLDMYGEWGYFPGYGYGWAPYAPFGWSPYSFGMWSMYPGWGMTWISGEPWGWLPFHYGCWNFEPTMGWFWMPGSFGMWNPALVNWYSGPGWVGWAPRGPGGAPVCQSAGCITAVAPGSLGRPLRPGGPGTVRPDPNTPFRLITRPPVEPHQLAMLSGQPVGKDVIFPGGPRGALISGDGRLLPPPTPHGSTLAARPEAVGPMRSASLGRTAAPGGSPLSGADIAAPSTVLMGRTVSSDAALSNAFLNQGYGGKNGEPIRAQLGETLGGRLPTISDGRGNLVPLSPSRGPSVTLLRGSPHTRGLAFSRSTGGFGRAGGGFGHVGGSLGMARSGGGSHGFGGGFHGFGGGFHGGGGGGHR